MPTPPNPGLPPALLQLLAQLVYSTYRPVVVDARGLELGSFADLSGGRFALYLTDEGWVAAPESAAGPALGPFAVTLETALVLQEGYVASWDAPYGSGVYPGSGVGESGYNVKVVLHAGKPYRIQALVEGGRLIARAVPVEASAS